MNRKKLLSLLLIMLPVMALQAQDCRLFFPDESGSVREMSNFERKDKFTGKSIQEILDVNRSGGKVVVDVVTRIYDEDEVEISSHQLQILCENGVFKVDMSEYLGDMLKQYQDMDLEMSGDNLTFPSDISVGDNLGDASLNVKVSSGGITVMNMNVEIKNRNVEAREEITTDAGTFDCYKINYDMETKMGIMNMTTSATEWIAEGVGAVKTESYNKKGKLVSYSLLTDFEK